MLRQQPKFPYTKKRFPNTTVSLSNSQTTNTDAEPNTGPSMNPTTIVPAKPQASILPAPVRSASTDATTMPAARKRIATSSIARKASRLWPSTVVSYPIAHAVAREKTEQKATPEKVDDRVPRKSTAKSRGGQG